MRHPDRTWWQDNSRQEPVLASSPIGSGFDLLVVGAGAAGLSAAIHAAKKGWHVGLVDIAGPGSGAAGRNGGFLLAGLSSFFHDAIKFYGVANAATAYELTLQELERMWRTVPSARNTGSLRRVASGFEQQDIIEQHAALRTFGFASKLKSANELEILSDGVFHPLDHVRGLCSDALTLGVEFMFGHKVINISTGCVVLEHGIEIPACYIAVCIDGGLEVVLPQLAPRVESKRLQMIATAPTELCESQAVYRRYGMDYVQQRPDGSLLIGGYRDFDSEANVTGPVTAGGEVISRLEAWAAELAPRAAITNRWAGACAWTKTGVPIIEEVIPRVWAAGAYSGTGNLWSPMCGRAIVANISNDESHIKFLPNLIKNMHVHRLSQLERG